jgi:salicylate hydroxylase
MVSSISFFVTFLSTNKNKVVAFHSQPTWDSDDWVVPMNHEHLENDFKDWSSTVNQILSLMEKPDVWALWDDPPASTYYKGRAALLGDAAHATTPNQGAGAGMAIEDAYILGALLGDINSADEIEAAFKAYDTVRRPRSQKLVTTSRAAGRLYGCELEGDDPEAIKKDLDGRFGWIWEHDLTKDLQEAKAMMGGKDGLL